MVLILVLMEDTLRVVNNGSREYSSLSVLILVLMEDTLREPESYTKDGKNVSLNPCFNGRYSQRHCHKGYSLCQG